MKEILERAVSVPVASADGGIHLAYVDLYDNSFLPVGRNFKRTLKKEFGRNILYLSALRDWRGERTLRYFLSQQPIDVAIDLGTAKGITAALIAHYANKVYTFDKRELLVANSVWDRFGQKDKIKFIKVSTNRDKTEAIKTLDFDFAFIDDQHDYEGARIGFEATKKCGRVLFHDYSDKWPGVKEFVDTLPKKELTIKNTFAFWKG